MLNGTVLLNVKHVNRAWLVSVLAVTSFILTGTACYCADKSDSWFYAVVVSSALTGLACGIGEATFLGFCKGFPSYTVGYVSSGTGFAGLSGTLMLLILKAIGLSNGDIFMVAIPTIIFYQAAYVWLNRRQMEYHMIL